MGQRRRVDAAMRLPPQSAAGHVRAQHRLSDRRDGMTPADYARARRVLMRRDPILGGVIKRIGPCGLAARQRKDHLTALIGAIVSQQLSTKAAAAIFGRFVALFPYAEIPGAAAIDVLTSEQLRGVGLSGQKCTYLRDLCARIADGRLRLGEP